VSRRRNITVLRDIKELPGENILESVKKLNITNSGFFIQKAEIEIVTQKSKTNFIANVRFELPYKFLITLKSKAGIEGARIYVSEDTILINDRINKKLYTGNALYLKRKYGLTQNLLPIVFGDIVLSENFTQETNECKENVLNIISSVKGILVNYKIDCGKRKIKQVNQDEGSVRQGFAIKYEKFIKIGNSSIPEIVEMNDKQSNTVIRIKILKLESPWSGTIKFIPGKGYDIIDLV
jgi:hypothetical protein